ncbi:hypothetical protein A2382_03295 [Candidatus Woesebacteria bacterium RIFOXYB1_FULL_38_16]|uniref:CAAX prenyl protease 2/Lysostaphin resistance protein A-like domain-containing protein n=1 Tax=Candidatus Woesebacteria bacterium RIFOXYB1_FULL_38_16 TaxID=1802538 RepID=A0A1F8CTW4_9BACT|nr:MAG: hypothetical protein A2382_03295 [Candidatus Woesebacteria bacterium RIFOXYB1_FULL_38_16]
MSVSSQTKLKHATILFTFIFLAWSCYRLLFQLPQEIEELILKPIFWLLPVYYFVRLEKAQLKSLGFTTEKIFPVIYLSLFLGTLFAIEGLFVNYFKYHEFEFSSQTGQQALIIPFLISFATAFSEEITFRGFIFTRLAQSLKNTSLANLISSLGWVAIHLPIAILDWQLSPINLISYLLLIFAFSLAVTFLFSRTKNILLAIMLHVMWQWPIILFR